MLGRGHRFLEAFGDDVALVRPHLRPVSLSAGQVLNEPGEEIGYVYFLRSGVVSKLIPFEDGTEIECVLVGQRGAVGAMSALGVRTAITRDVCHLACEAWRLPTERLGEASRRSERIHDVLDHYCAWMMTCVIRNGACNARHAVENRLCRWLLTCSDVLDSDEIALSQDVFAKMLGVQRSSVSPILQKLRRDGLISLERARLRLLDRPGLMTRACECYAVMKSAEHRSMSTMRKPAQILGVVGGLRRH